MVYLENFTKKYGQLKIFPVWLWEGLGRRMKEEITIVSTKKGRVRKAVKINRIYHLN